MIELSITRRCGHIEKIAVAGFSGSLEDVPLKYKLEVSENIDWQRDKLCIKCFSRLSKEDKDKLVKNI